ncbi:hypothetical protein Q3W71_06505 [Micromonospora sp. C28SCA-DRY-2]|uniref:hypothetical protein n=1 Tax=Micromonospora sp. C28SCA-DRY-2 TaxID=3059522 RepID=UPI002675FD23|nr:hypothetical protein [Micromonospora sp. C28SCA-DRY-2]MDO3701332.1 hypothetical protein [Micromonospora sp. C28SCA-DRY-2]
MHPQPPAGEAALRDGPGQDRPPPSARRPRRRALLVAAVLVPVLLAAAVVTYLAGGFHDEGRFRAEPPACATVAPSVRLLGPAYALEQDDTNNCDLLLPPEHPSYVPAPTITVSYYVATPRRSDAPDAAAEQLRRLAAGFVRLPDVGDEAYLRDRSIFLRVNNLVVGIVVFPRVVSTEEQVLAFATDLADRLGDG